ncbi:DNA repair protein RadA [bacterium]|nr:DNA repair protein RadA [bacterium]
MAKNKSQFVCQGCGHVNAKWLGKCPSCHAWNSFVEESFTPVNDQGSLAELRDQFKVAKESPLADSPFDLHDSLRSSENWVLLEDDEQAQDQGHAQARVIQRHATGMRELDRVLGGGLVPDSFVLLGGDPGIGKSTLLLQMAQGISEKQSHLKIFYVSGEESTDQIRSRAKRLGVKSSGKIYLGAETQLERVFASVKELKPHVLIMDSLQTFSTGFIQSAPGSVSQVREVTARLMTLAKTAGISVWLVGHVTKEGSIAGPKTVEHMVDTVLYFEGEGGQSYRLLRTVKNRFGSNQELGVFEMDGEGLREVLNPSSLFLVERKDPVTGTAVAASLEGTRPLLVELQALVTSSTLAVPRRTAVGMDHSRVSLIAAILEKYLKLPLADLDLFFNVSGGLKLAEPACDLAVAAAIWSSTEERKLSMGTVFIGELGLTGEIRRVSQSELRIEEARRLGFKMVVLPENTPKSVKEKYSKSTDIKLIYLSRIEELETIK